MENGFENFRDCKKLKWNTKSYAFEYQFPKEEDNLLNRSIKHKKTERTTLKSKKGVSKNTYGKLNHN